MFKHVEGLKKKLGLSKSQKLTARPFQRNTRNTNYILDVDGEARYFLKVEAEGHDKERKVHEFLSHYPLVPSISPVYIDERLMVFPFFPDLRDARVGDNLDFILKFHSKSLSLPSELFEKYFGGRQFSNLYLSRFVDRIGRHREMVENFWQDSKELEDYYSENSGKNFEGLPKILVHGDIQHKNLQTNGEGVIVLIDFEDSYFDSPAWDLTRPLMDLSPEEFGPFVETYVKNSEIGDKTKLRRVIHRDFLVRIVTDAIGRQQRFGERNAQRYLDLYRKYAGKIREILDQ